MSTSSSERLNRALVGTAATLCLRADRRALFDRTAATDASDRASATASIVATVRRDGDAALRALAVELRRRRRSDAPRCRERDGVRRSTRSTQRCGRRMERSARNIERVHRAFRPVAAGDGESSRASIVGRRPDPLGARRRLCARRTRRVSEQCSDGRRSGARRRRRRDRALLAAIARHAHAVERRPRRGRARGRRPRLRARRRRCVAAMAYGTASVPRVDRIVGPGNAYVAEAKLQVVQRRGDRLARRPERAPRPLPTSPPTPRCVAREMLAQAEHDPLAAVVAVTTSERALDDILSALEAGLATQPRADICRAALAGQGAVLVRGLAGRRDRVRERVRPGAPSAASSSRRTTCWRRCATRAPCSSARRPRSRSATT